MATVASLQTVHLQAQLPAHWSMAELQQHLGDTTVAGMALRRS
jgi:hypothetical protein